MRLLGLLDLSLFSLLSLSSLSLFSLSSSCFFIEASFSCSICRCFISSFFSSRNAVGIPAMFSCALNSSGHSSPMNSLAFFPFKKPVRLICIILESGFCKETTGRQTGYLKKQHPVYIKLKLKLPWGLQYIYTQELILF